jgi:hypothetical protein
MFALPLVTKSAPDLPDPFAPLPACPPGMLQNSHGLPVAQGDVPSGYPLPIPWDGILVDDPGLDGKSPHPEDLVERVRLVLRLLWPESHAEIEAEACEILGVKELRDYLPQTVRFLRRPSQTLLQVTAAGAHLLAAVHGFGGLHTLAILSTPER